MHRDTKVRSSGSGATLLGESQHHHLPAVQPQAGTTTFQGLISICGLDVLILPTSYFEIREVLRTMCGCSKHSGFKHFTKSTSYYLI